MGADFPASPEHRYASVAVCVPCYNEAVTIASVIEGFHRHLPGARVFVFDNNSTDATAQIAAAHGAKVFRVLFQGKGNVVRRAFADVDAAVYILVDGDGTYNPADAPIMVDKLLDEQLDMVIGCRREDSSDEGMKYRSGHRTGNLILTRVLARMFGGGFTDILSGYRAFSRRYVKSFPAFSNGFETETELTVHALALRMPCGEVSTLYGSRPAGSDSKLSTYRDGVRIFRAMLGLFIAERPLRFFMFISLVLTLLTVALFAPVMVEYLHTGLVRRFPTAVLCTGLVMVSLLTVACGLIQDNVTRGRQEAKRLLYLSIPAPR